jgi:hypothetical protein
MPGITIRLILALVGILLWCAYPYVFWAGTVAVHLYWCSREPWVSGEDPCFWDHIPVMEMAIFVAMGLLLYPFARFAFTLFAPAQRERGRFWILAGKSDSTEYFPVLQVAAVGGIALSLLHATRYLPALYPFLAYWTLWVAWFCAGIWLSWPAKPQAR